MVWLLLFAALVILYGLGEAAFGGLFEWAFASSPDGRTPVVRYAARIVLAFLLVIAFGMWLYHVFTWR